MFTILQGRAGTGKSSQLLEQIQTLTTKGKPVLLLVPEQFTFETERKFYNQCGARVFSKLNVTSFTRYAHELFKTYGGKAGDYADDSVKMMLMTLSLDEVRDLLTVYQKSAAYPAFAEQMIATIATFKHEGLDSEAFASEILQVEQGALRQKLADIATIYQNYDARVTARFRDALDDLSRAGLLCKEHRPLAGYTLVIDEFKGFTQTELSFLKVLMTQVEDCIVSLCTDGQSPLFQTVEHTKQQLIDIARQANMTVAVPKTLDVCHRFQSLALAFLEEHSFSTENETYEGDLQGLQVVLAPNEYDEAEFVAASIRKFVLEGYRYRDIVVVGRGLDAYQSALQASFDRYEIPFYSDRVKSLAESPIVRLISHAFLAMHTNTDSTPMLSMLKCGLTPFDVELVARLENYLYYWNLSPKEWAEDFGLSTFGVQGARTPAQVDEDAQILAALNHLRQTVYQAVYQAKQVFATRSPRRMAEGLLQLLEDLGVRDSINQALSATDLADGQAVSSHTESKRSFTMVVEALQLLVSTMGNTALAPDRFEALFLVVCGSTELANIPQTVDCVLVGSAERIRTEDKKIVLIIGANDKVFPYVPSEDAILPDRERLVFTESTGITLSMPLKQQIFEEQFIAYKTLTMASEHVVISARMADLKGASLAPSMLFSKLEELYGKRVIGDTQSLPALFYCSTTRSAFAKMAHLFQEDSALSATLKEYFASSPDYKTMMDGMAHMALNQRHQLSDIDQLKELFGKQMTLSPSQIEQFYRCKFRYFCEYALGLSPRERYQLNAMHRGNIVHEIVGNICAGITDYSQFDRDQMQLLIQTELADYLQKVGGTDRQTERFLHLYQKLSDSILSLLERLFEELGDSLFRPTDFEYAIGRDGNTDSYTLIHGDYQVHLRGIIDRIDRAVDQDGKQMVRIIDYKTGSKEFKLADIYNGLNLQMMLYLLCLTRQAQADFRTAGALYVPAGAIASTLGREVDASDIDRLERQHYRMHGLVVNNKQVLLAMEPHLNGTYTPIAVKASAYDKERNLKDDVFEGNAANGKQFLSSAMESMVTDKGLSLLYGHIEGLLHEMAQSLYEGDIEAKPLLDSCAYCNFKDYCGYDVSKAPTDYIKCNNCELFDLLEKEQSDGND